jgi:hypothetical protein
MDIYCSILAESLRCAGQVAQIEELLSTELSVYAHQKSGKNIIRTSGTFCLMVSVIACATIMI